MKFKILRKRICSLALQKRKSRKCSMFSQKSTKRNEDAICLKISLLCRKLKLIPDNVSSKFLEMAKTFIEELGAERAVSACLASAIGNSEALKYEELMTSPLSGKRGRKAMILELNIDFQPRKSLLFKLFEKSGIDVQDDISHVQFTQGRQVRILEMRCTVWGVKNRFLSTHNTQKIIISREGKVVRFTQRFATSKPIEH